MQRARAALAQWVNLFPPIGYLTMETEGKNDALSGK